MSTDPDKSPDRVKIFAGRYAYVKPLGRGAGGAVYLAEDLYKDRRQVALKVLTPEAYGTVQGKMLRREFEILSKLDHPNLVRVYDYGRLPDGGVFLAEEYIDGFSLQDARALLEPAALVDLTMQILQGLSYLHGMGMIHRDIKPANVMLLWLDDEVARPMVKLVDFGLSSMDPKRDTLRGGTRSYMAPEIIRGEKGEPQSDLFSLGVTLYYAMCGVLPFGPRSKDDPPPTEDGFRPPEPHRLNPEVPLALSRFTNALLRQVSGLAFTDACEAMGTLARDVEGAALGQLANNMEVAAPHVLRGYFERGVLAEQEVQHENMVQRLTHHEPTRHGYLYLIVGDAQVGKSRLLREVETTCKLQGRHVISVACPPSGRPWGVMRLVLERLMELTRQRQGSPLERYRRHVAVLESLDRLTLRPEDVVVRQQASWMREALLEAAPMLYEDGVMLSLEDLHLADASSLDFLARWFSSEEPTSRLDVVAASRPGEQLEALARGSRVYPIVCEGLNARDVQHLFTKRMGLVGFPSAWIEEVALRSEGMPAYLEEVCRGLVDAGVLQCHSTSRWSVELESLAQHPPPASLRESFRRRVNVVGAAGRELLELLTLLGRPTRWTSLRGIAQAGGETAQAVDRAIEVLLWRHLARLQLDMLGRQVSVVDPAIGQIVTLLLGPEWRRALHRRIGEQLQREWMVGGGSTEEVAVHLKHGGRLEQAALFAWARGLECLAARDPLEARVHLGFAARGELRGPQRVPILLGRARAALGCFLGKEASDALTLAVEEAEQSRVDWLYYQACAQAAEGAMELGEVEMAEGYLARLSEALPVMMERPQALLVTGATLAGRGDLRGAWKRWLMALARAEHFGDVLTQIDAQSALAHVAAVCGQVEEATSRLQRAYDLATAHQLTWALAPALLTHARLVEAEGEQARAMTLLVDTLTALGRRPNASTWLETLLELTELELERGRLAEAERHAIEALVVARRLGHRALEALATIGVASVALHQDRGSAMDHLARMRDAFAALTALPFHVHWQARAAHTLAVGHGLAEDHAQRVRYETIADALITQLRTSSPFI